MQLANTWSYRTKKFVRRFQIQHKPLRSIRASAAALGEPAQRLGFDMTQMACDFSKRRGLITGQICNCPAVRHLRALGRSTRQRLTNQSVDKSIDRCANKAANRPYHCVFRSISGFSNTLLQSVRTGLIVLLGPNKLARMISRNRFFNVRHGRKQRYEVPDVWKEIAIRIRAN